MFNPGRDYYEYLPIFEPYNEDGTFRLYNKVISGKETDGSPKWSENRFLNSVAEREENIYNQKTLYTNANLMLRYDIFLTQDNLVLIISQVRKKFIMLVLIGPE